MHPYHITYKCMAIAALCRYTLNKSLEIKYVRTCRIVKDSQCVYFAHIYVHIQQYLHSNIHTNVQKHHKLFKQL